MQLSHTREPAGTLEELIRDPLKYGLTGSFNAFSSTALLTRTVESGWISVLDLVTNKVDFGDLDWWDLTGSPSPTVSVPPACGYFSGSMTNYIELLFGEGSPGYKGFLKVVSDD